MIDKIIRKIKICIRNGFPLDAVDVQLLLNAYEKEVEQNNKNKEKKER